MPMRIGSDLPELGGATEWVGPRVDRADLVGSPTLIHFWAVSCYICKNNLPTLAQWRDAYGPKGLKVVSVHMPRSEADTDVAKVKADIAAYGITEPCAVDNDHQIKDAFQNVQGFVPAYFLFDADGKLRNRTAGDAGLKMLEGTLKRLMETEPAAV